MSVLKKIQKRSLRRKLKVRNSIRLDHKNNKIRISIFRSLKEIYAQAIDDSKSITISSVCSKDIKAEDKPKVGISHEAGKLLAEKLKNIGVEAAIFDRGMYLYHGRVKAFAEGLREGGLKV